MPSILRGLSFVRKDECVTMIQWLSRWQYKYKGIPNLMRYIIIGSAIIYLLGFLGIHTVALLGLDPQAVLHGQIWRLVSFVFLLPVGSILFAAFAFYFYYLVGQALEEEWGSFVFTAYYFCNVLLTVLISFLTKTTVTSAASVNLSLFLAFGYLYPDYTILLFMVLPIKMKYLAIFYGVYAVYEAIMLPTLGAKLMVLVGVLTFVLFFYRELWQWATDRSAVRQNRKNFQRRRGDGNLRVIRHQCEVCKRTELDDPHLEFRYCSGCDGYHEYCLDHLHNHVHIKEK